MKKNNSNRKSILAFAIIILALIEISIFSYIVWKDKRNTNNNEQIENDYMLDRYDEISKYEIQQQEEDLKKEINDKNTIHYTMIESSDNSVVLEYAYVTPNYTKIKLSYTDKNEIYIDKDYEKLTEEEKRNIQDRNLEIRTKNIEYEERLGYPYIETLNGKEKVAQRTDDSDGGKTINGETGYVLWNDTFLLSTNEATDELTLSFLNSTRNEIKIKLKKQDK